MIWSLSKINLTLKNYKKLILMLQQSMELAGLTHLNDKSIL